MIVGSGKTVASKQVGNYTVARADRKLSNSNRHHRNARPEQRVAAGGITAFSQNWGLRTRGSHFGATGSPFDEEDCDDCTQSTPVAAHSRTSTSCARSPVCRLCHDNLWVALVPAVVYCSCAASVRRDTAGKELERPTTAVELKTATRREAEEIGKHRRCEGYKQLRTFVLIPYPRLAPAIHSWTGY